MIGRILVDEILVGFLVAGCWLSVVVAGFGK